MRAVFLLALSPGLVFAAAPTEGVQTSIRRGLFTEANIGVMATLGGRDHYSNAQTYLQLGVGYDLSAHLELAAQFGLGTSAANCFAARQSGQCELADSFTIGFVNLTGAYLIPLAPRLYLAPELTAGYSSLDPAPVLSSSGQPVRSAPNVGGGLSVEYATQLNHFSVGVELTSRFILRTSIVSLAIFPRLKYTF